MIDLVLWEVINNKLIVSQKGCFDLDSEKSGDAIHSLLSCNVDG